jgi:D-arabinose 1-dehydrogenase-like Zn-dependent alcohol dehydrogenase
MDSWRQNTRSVHDRSSYTEQLDELERAITLVAEGCVKTMVMDGPKPLEEVNEAFDALQAGDLVGRVVLDVGDMS